MERSVFPKIINIFREIKGMALGALYALRPERRSVLVLETAATLSWRPRAAL